jgi:SAM-dependent methyltransferase
VTSLTTNAPGHGGSASIGVDDYWWYRVRTDLLRTVFEERIGEPGWLLDIGSADGPSVDWLRSAGRKVSMDIDPRGLKNGGVCGSALQLPFADGAFDVVGAFDVIEHCEPEDQALQEVARVLAPGGRFLMSVPAYQWAWSDFDIDNGHHRRYTKKRAVAAVEASGLRVERATYAFAGVFPLFAAERLVRRVKERGKHHEPADIVEVPEVSPRIDRLLTRLSGADRKLLATRDLPFGSSVLVAAVKPA